MFFKKIISFSQNDQEKGGISAEAGRNLVSIFLRNRTPARREWNAYVCQRRDDEVLTPKLTIST
jgi:hypothetical protein